MITIYHLETSRSERIIWLMEELGLPYDLQRFPRDASMRAGEAYRALHPRGKSPIIRDGDTVLIESGAIVEYVISRYGDGRLSASVGAPEYARYLQWLHFAEGTVMTQFLVELFLRRSTANPDRSQAFVDSIGERTLDILTFIDNELEGQAYFAGREFTAADIMMVYCFGMAGDFLNVDMTRYPNIAAYLGRIAQRPAYRKAMAIANPTQSV